MMRFAFILFLLLSLTTPPSTAQSADTLIPLDQAYKTVHIIRLNYRESPLSLMVKLDDDCWKNEGNWSQKISSEYTG